MAGIITLTTDFGINDAYVGIMKGVILGINPDIHLIDISHGIEPQNIPQAAYILDTAHPYFPKGTIHVVVIDPGVGSDRRAVILRTSEALFVAPDNGVLSYVEKDMVEAVAITNPRFWLNPASTTFHGRDIFAPVAARLSLGTALCEFGEAATSLITLPPSEPIIEADGTLIGCVIHIDRFGNLITNIKHRDLQRKDQQIEVKGHCIKGLSYSYDEGDELLALIGSDGRIEIAARNGSAVALLEAKVGDRVDISVP